MSRGPEALRRNQELEYERNGERFAFLKWSSKAFRNTLVVPPGSGICHQVRVCVFAHAMRIRTINWIRAWTY